MSMSESNSDLARRVFGAFETGDRDALEALIAEEFHFSSPYDDRIDRAAFFERCWPNHELLRTYAYRRMVEAGDDVVVTYEAERRDGSRFRNTEVLTFSGGRLVGTEVYFGWDLTDA
jgi:ketosteroid isomerase-like protein